MTTFIVCQNTMSAMLWLQVTQYQKKCCLNTRNPGLVGVSQMWRARSRSLWFPWSSLLVIHWWSQGNGSPPNSEIFEVGVGAEGSSVSKSLSLSPGRFPFGVQKPQLDHKSIPQCSRLWYSDTVFYCSGGSGGRLCIHHVYYYYCLYSDVLACGLLLTLKALPLPGLSVKESACQYRILRRYGFDPWVRKILATKHVES